MHGYALTDMAPKDNIHVVFTCRHDCLFNLEQNGVFAQAVTRDCDVTERLQLHHRHLLLWKMTG